jgi:thiosulfate/3-mercaptopyruvate sulfurtransferase
MTLLVRPDELEVHREDLERQRWALIDARPAARYQAGHLPGAVSVPLLAVIRVEKGIRRIAPYEMLERLFGDAGVDLDTAVVVYGGRESVDAANLFWVLECCGHPDVRLLDGGIERWMRGGWPLTPDVPEIEPKRFRDPQVQIVDNRTPEEYSGEERYARRGGHIPGAALLPYDVTLRSDGSFKSPEEIFELHRRVGLDPALTVVNYCQSGTRSAHTYFAQRLAGFHDPRVYEGSWAEWGNDERAPVER